MTNSICDPGSQSEVGRWGKDSPPDSLTEACKDAARVRPLIQKANFDGKLDTRHLDHQWDSTTKPVHPGIALLRYIEIFAPQDLKVTALLTMPLILHPHTQKIPLNLRA